MKKPAAVVPEYHPLQIFWGLDLYYNKPWLVHKYKTESYGSIEFNSKKFDVRTFL